MAVLIWLLGGFVLVAGCYAGVAINSISLPSNAQSGRAFLKKSAKRKGVDVNSIPDRIWQEIVEVDLAWARRSAATSSNPIDRNFRASFARQLTRDADTIAGIMSGVTGTSLDRQTRGILIRNGVISPY